MRANSPSSQWLSPIHSPCACHSPFEWTTVEQSSQLPLPLSKNATELHLFTRKKKTNKAFTSSYARPARRSQKGYQSEKTAAKVSNKEPDDMTTNSKTISSGSCPSAYWPHTYLHRSQPETVITIFHEGRGQMAGFAWNIQSSSKGQHVVPDFLPLRILKDMQYTFNLL